MEIDNSNATEGSEESIINVVDVENVEPQLSEEAPPVEVSSSSPNESTQNNVVNKEKSSKPKSRLVRLPLGRVKSIMKVDSECSVLSQEAVFLVTKATELFLELMAKETVRHTQVAKRKTILRRDIDATVEDIPNLWFLEGTLD